MDSKQNHKQNHAEQNIKEKGNTEKGNTEQGHKFKVEYQEVEVEKIPHPFIEFWRSFISNRGSLVGFCFICFLIFVAIFADFLAPHDPIMQNRENLLLPPSWLENGKFSYFLGTDDLGRDMLSRIIYGARYSISNGIIIVGLSLAMGISLGLVSGYFGGIVDTIIMRFIDIVIAIPSLLLAIAVTAILGPSLINAAMALAFVSIPAYVRLTRASVLSEKNKDYVISSAVAGAGPLRLMFNTILPNTLSPLVVQATLGFSNAILEMAGLGFLGLGAQPPTPEWGTMLSSSLIFIQSSWWVVTFPGVSILLTVIAFNLMGDGLRDALDPKLKK